MTAYKPVLQLKEVCKRFDGLQALDHVDLELRPGEVHALIGENGAGKSTLIKILSGAYPLDDGRMELDGTPITPRTPFEAQGLGISTVHQEVNLLPNLSVAQNLFLGREPRRFGCIQWRKVHSDAKVLLGRFNLDIDVRANLSSFSIAIQQLIAIARSMARPFKVLILDEPTASLDAREVAMLFGILSSLREQGVTIVFVTHFLDQVYNLSDRITVLRNGKRVGTFVTNSLPRDELISHMLGRELQEVEQPHRRHLAPPTGSSSVLQLESVCAGNGIHNLTFTAVRGDAIGLAGLLGSGRSEVCAILFGLTDIKQGTINLQGERFSPTSPAHAVQHGVAFCPEDRRTAGIVDPLSVRENIVLALQAQRGWWRPLSIAEQKTLVAEALNGLRIECSDSERPIGELSGGNQQKVMLARWLATKPRILILDEPTRGIDVGAHAEIVRLIRRLRADGMTLIVASSEIEELAAFSTEVLILRDKQLVGTVRGDRISEDAIVSAIVRPA